MRVGALLLLLLPAAAAAADGEVGPSEWVEELQSETMFSWAGEGRMNLVLVESPSQVDADLDAAFRRAAQTHLGAEAEDEVAFGRCDVYACERALASLKKRGSPLQPPRTAVLVLRVAHGRHRHEWYTGGADGLDEFIDVRLRTLRVRVFRHREVVTLTRPLLTDAKLDHLNVLAVTLQGEDRRVKRRREIAEGLYGELSATVHGGPTGSVLVGVLDPAERPDAAKAAREITGSDKLPAMMWIPVEGNVTVVEEGGAMIEDFDVSLEFVFQQLNEEVPGQEAARASRGLTRKEFDQRCVLTGPCVVFIYHQSCTKCADYDWAIDEVVHEAPDPDVLIGRISGDRHPDLLEMFRGASYLQNQAEYRRQQVEEKEDRPPAMPSLRWSLSDKVRSDGGVGEHNAPIVLWYAKDQHMPEIIPLPSGSRSCARALRRFIKAKKRFPDGLPTEPPEEL